MRGDKLGNTAMKSMNATLGSGSNKAARRVVDYYFVARNKTSLVAGNTDDTVASLWGGLLAGAVLVGVGGVCMVILCYRYRQRTARQPAYEGLPLIIVKTVRR